MFLYAGYAKVSAFNRAYATVRETLPAHFAAVHAFWGNPLFPCGYGPLWLWLDRLSAGGAHTIPQSVFIERFTSLVALLLIVWALIALIFRLAQ